LLGRRLLEQPDRLGAAVETAFFKHLFTRFYKESPTFSYWRDRKSADREVDIIAELAGRLVPFEVKYQGTEITAKKLQGLRIFLEQRKLDQGYVITQRWEDFGVMSTTVAFPRSARKQRSARVLKIPAPLACFWLSP
jgi:predicted AAA+ superfamily ATPase